MIPIYSRFEEPFIYGPITDKELSKMKYHHRWVQIDGQHFVATQVEIKEWASRQIARPEPPPVEQTTEEVAAETVPADNVSTNDPAVEDPASGS